MAQISFSNGFAQGMQWTGAVGMGVTVGAAGKVRGQEIVKRSPRL